MTPTQQGTEFLNRLQMAAIFKCDPKTIDRWAETGRIPEDCYVVTPGGRRRYKESKVKPWAAANGYDV